MSIADKLTSIAENMNEVYQKGVDKGMLPMYYFHYNLGRAFKDVTFHEGCELNIRVKELSEAWNNEAFYNTKNLKKVTLIIESVSTNVTSLSANGMFNTSPELEVIEVSFPVPLSDVRHFISTLPKLKSVFGALDVSQSTRMDYFGWSCPALEDLEFVPNTIIGTTSLSSCPNLSKASITSIVNGLSPDTSGLTLTLSQTAVNNAFTAEEWEALKATKPNWSFAY